MKASLRPVRGQSGPNLSGGLGVALRPKLTQPCPTTHQDIRSQAGSRDMWNCEDDCRHTCIVRGKINVLIFEGLPKWTGSW